MEITGIELVTYKFLRGVYYIVGDVVFFFGIFLLIIKVIIKSILLLNVIIILIVFLEFLVDDLRNRFLDFWWIMFVKVGNNDNFFVDGFYFYFDVVGG